MSHKGGYAGKSAPTGHRQKRMKAALTKVFNLLFTVSGSKWVFRKESDKPQHVVVRPCLREQKIGSAVGLTERPKKII